MISAQKISEIHIAICGSDDFCRRMAASIAAQAPGSSIYSGQLAEAWSLILTNRPDCLLLEVGLHHSERIHSALRKLLNQVRERFENKIYTIAVLSAPEKLFYGGDLLFQNENSFTPSGFIDSFVVQPPASIPSIMGLSEQLIHALSLCAAEMTRRSEGKQALPALGLPGWAQSLSDPSSRELWMQWLPRYASYTNENPIIIGETGTGKTNLAYALHQLSGRKGQFVSITPRDFTSSELVQAELFGAVSGAYTGAVDKWGLVKMAERGTLFIDELQSIDKDLQGKIITFIENKAYRRVGSAESLSADVRFVFASNRSLYEMMDSNILRHDFAYRLERVQLEMPALNKRPLDIPAAFAYALAKIRRQRLQARQVFGLNSQAYRMIFAHSWPGNLRQLENNVARLCELSDIEDSDLISHQSVLKLFEARLRNATPTTADIVSQAALSVSKRVSNESISTLEHSIEVFSEEVRNKALEACGGDCQQAAQILGDDANLLKVHAQVACAKKELLKGEVKS